MKRHFINAAYGLLDYASYPLGMLLVAPIILRRLGASEYGLWMIAAAVISTGGIVASGFCDANIRRIASLRATGDAVAMVRTVCSMLGINLALGTILVIVVWIAAPYAAHRLTISSSTPFGECLIALRIAGCLILARAVESVAVSTQRAFEQYREPVQIGITVRLLTLASAAVLAILKAHTVCLLISTAILVVLGTWIQFRQLRRLFGSASLWPVLRTSETSMLLGTGVFLWLQAIGGMIFGHLDRILLGLSLGASMVTPYVLCIQFSQPVFGITASGLHFLFPHLSARADVVSRITLRRTIVKAFLLNLVMVGGISGTLLLFGDQFLRLWAGLSLASRAQSAFRPVVLGAALTALSVTGVYSLQALGRFRAVSIVLLSCRAIMSLLMLLMIHLNGLKGLLFVRVLYGVTTLVVYVPLISYLREITKSSPLSSGGVLQGELTGGSKA